MHGMPFAFVMFAQVMDLGMAVMTWRDGIIRTRAHDLLGLQPPIFPACLGKSRLQETAPAAATVVVGLVGRHVDEVLLADDLLHHVAQIIGHGVAESLSDQLTGVLNGEGDL